MYNDINEKLLLDLFRIAAPSSKEDNVADFIARRLKHLDISFTEDKYGNIYNVSNKGKPLLSSHMDAVQKESDANLARFINIYDSDKGLRILKGLGNVGGDDKCGIYAILEILRNYKDLNFIFSREEEIGCVGISSFVKDAGAELKSANIPYGIVIDRRGKGDIICHNNNYGSIVFQDDIAKIGKEYGFTPTTGSTSDANTLKQYFSCANISCGYYRPHSKQEFVVLADLLNTINYVEKMITELKASYPPPVYAAPVTSTSYKKGKTYNSRDWRNDDWDDVNGFLGRNSKKSGKETPRGPYKIHMLCDGCSTYHNCVRIKSIVGTNVYICEECMEKVMDELADLRTASTLIDEMTVLPEV